MSTMPSFLLRPPSVNSELCGTCGGDSCPRFGWNFCRESSSHWRRKCNEQSRYVVNSAGYVFRRADNVDCRASNVENRADNMDCRADNVANRASYVGNMAGNVANRENKLANLW